jgi:uncharacterized protein
MKIPAYPESRALDISDKPLLDRILNELQPRISELSFAGLFLFRTAHDYRLTMIDDSIVVLGRGYDVTEYFLRPLSGNIQKAISTLFSDGLPLYGADGQFVNEYLADSDVIVTEDRDSFDYIYLKDDLANLPGNRFHKKKNRINYFTNRHSFEVRTYSGNLACGCLELLNSWRQAARNTGSRSLDMEVVAATEAIRNFSGLELSGIVVLVENRVSAFVIGERLNLNTAVCHFEKADPFMEGISQLANREFARLLFPECAYINREQDLGEAGLRKAKLSYHPVELLKKYRATQLRA